LLSLARITGTNKIVCNSIAFACIAIVWTVRAKIGVL
jgi:hypothetical protein